MQLYLTSIVTVIVYASCAALGLTLFAPSILALISPGYLEAASALRVLAWALVFMSGNLISTTIINAMGRHRFLILGATATLLVNLGLNLFLIPRWGILGASVATVITEAFNFLIQAGYIYVRKRPVFKEGLSE